MAHYIFKNAAITLGGTDFSADVEELTVNREQETPDDTTMGATFRRFIPGLQVYDLELTLHNDYTDNLQDEDIEALMGTTFAVAWKPDSGAISTSNPEWQFTGCIGEGGSGGTVGDIDIRKLSIKLASGTLTRDVTP